MTYKIYKHTSPSGKSYIGMTSQPLLNRYGGGTHYLNNPEFSNDIEKYGWDNFTHEVLARTADKDAARILENYFIIKSNAEYNKYKNHLIKKKYYYIEETDSYFERMADAANSISGNAKSIYEHVRQGIPYKGYHISKVYLEEPSHYQDKRNKAATN